MSGPSAGTSSGAAEAGEEALVIGDDVLDRRRLRRGVPLVELEGSAEDDPVGPREHVAGTSGQRIADLRLRLEDGELAARRPQVGIAEQIAAAQAGAVEDEALGQSGDVRGR